MSKAFISGCSGTELTAEEISFFRNEDPWGLILFRRNFETREQVSALTSAFRETVGRQDAPVLVDQEGGRVQRARPPVWRKYPAPKLFGDLYEKDAETGVKAARLGAGLIAAELAELGITVNCVPCLDLRLPETVDAIGDRAMSSDPDVVSTLGQAIVEGTLEAGVLPVIKHMPGHGRAQVDSHFELPKVDTPKHVLENLDFKPFSALSKVPFGMTAHIVFKDIDPDTPGTQSEKIIHGVIRDLIGFDGCLMSDDLSMKALGGTVSERAEKVIGAGCDLVLHCNGDMDEMQAVAEGVPELSGEALRRCQDALNWRTGKASDFDQEATWNEFLAITEWQGS